MIQKDLDEVMKLIKENINIIMKNYKIKLIYIFGSYFKEKNNKNSDLDIAVLLEDDFNHMDKLSLIGDFSDIFKRDDIDLIILNSANPVLRHQVIKYGKIAYMKNEDVKVNFKVKVLSVYMDMEPFRRTQMKYINEWVKNKVGGGSMGIKNKTFDEFTVDQL